MRVKKAPLAIPVKFQEFEIEFVVVCMILSTQVEIGLLLEDIP